MKRIVAIAAGALICVPAFGQSFGIQQRDWGPIMNSEYGYVKRGRDARPGGDAASRAYNERVQAPPASDDPVPDAGTIATQNAFGLNSPISGPLGVQVNPRIDHSVAVPLSAPERRQ